jgi:hypothetical protein
VEESLKNFKTYRGNFCFNTSIRNLHQLLRKQSGEVSLTCGNFVVSFLKPTYTEANAWIVQVIHVNRSAISSQKLLVLSNAVWLWYVYLKEFVEVQHCVSNSSPTHYFSSERYLAPSNPLAEGWLVLHSRVETWKYTQLYLATTWNRPG